MRLYAIHQIMECAGISDIAGHPRQIGYLVGQRVPLAAELIHRSMRRRWDRVALLDERVEIYHLLMIVEEIENDFPRHTRWEWCDGGENSALRHGGGVWK